MRKREGGRWVRERKSILTFLYRRMLKKVGMSRKNILEEANIVVSEMIFKMKLNEN